MFELSEEQKGIADWLLAGAAAKKSLQTLGGYAGTGKTTLTKHLHQELPTWAVCAFTGKAVDILRRKGMSADTIHSTIYKAERDGGKLRFVLRSLFDMPYEGFLVDEASMVSKELFADMQKFKKPIIAIGDHGQLPPVGDDAGLMKNPDYVLETIHRNAGPIAHFAEFIRLGGRPTDWKWQQSHDGSPFSVQVVNRDRMNAEVYSRADQIICAYNKSRVNINKVVRAHFGRKGKPAPGDRVMCLKNSLEHGIFNGQQGTIEEPGSKDFALTDKQFVFQPTFGSRVVVTPDPESWHFVGKREEPEGFRVEVPFDYAYAITCHKSQGDEWQKVIVLEEKCDLWEHKRWCYTAASRAKEKLLWVSLG